MSEDDSDPSWLLMALLLGVLMWLMIIGGCVRLFGR